MNLSELPLQPEALTDRTIAIKVVGVGGAGSNAVDRLKMDNLDRVQLAVINTDHQALSASPVQEKALIGTGVTRGLGAGGDPELGFSAADADREKIAGIVKGSDLIFLVAGMGGGTGSGAAPIVAEEATQAGALVIAFVTMPFSFEGGRRAKQAEDGLAALRRCCDAVIALPNDVLLQESEEGETVLNSFARADAWIGRGVRSLWSMLFRNGLINLDFATLRQAFVTRGGKTLFGLGSGAGESAVTQALETLKLCPLLHTPEFARKADRLLVNIVGGTDLTLAKVNEIMNAVTDQFGRDSHVIMGAVIDEAFQQQVEICVIGTSDTGARGVRRPSVMPPRRAATAAPTGTTAPLPLPEAPGAPTKHSLPPIPPGFAPTGGSVFPAAASKVAPAQKPAAMPVNQDEFLFGEIESRGYFDKTDRNLFEGQDLDVPTYLRKGIKVTF
ncbi:MAG: cell division protein FtsZ [Opitutaceae bacterium]|nr:cell division protein FtsZ [Opitutaceae bacterium]